MGVWCVHREEDEDQRAERTGSTRTMTKAELADVARRRGISLDVLLDDARSRGIAIDD